MTRYIEDLNENTAPVAGDFLLCYDASAGSTDKDRKVNVSKFAVLAVGNVFTTTQSIIPSATNANGLYVNMPTSTTAYAARFDYSGASRVVFIQNATENSLYMQAYDNGSSEGPYVACERNNNASTPSAGHILLQNRGATYYYFWPDASGNLRIGGSLIPTSANDTGGTVVGTQTSSLDSKNVLGEFSDDDDALAAILATPVYDFKYKSGAFNGEKFTGIITDYAPTFGMDRDAAHPAGKSLNEITAIGYTFAAFKALTRRIEELERRAA